MKYRLKDTIFIVMCFLILSLGMTILIYTNYNYHQITQKIIVFDEQNIDSVYLKVVDEYDMKTHKTLREFFSEPNSLERMKQFSNVMKDKYGYLEIDNQSVMILDQFPYKEEFRIDYGESHYGVNDAIGISLKSLQIGKNTYDAFALSQQIEMGTGFQAEDFLWKEQKTVPMLLGYEYQGLAEIGETFLLEYLQKDILVEVAGFFKKDAVITLNNQVYFMDQQIVIPFFDCKDQPTNEEDSEFQKILYSLKNWGYIKVNSGEDVLDYEAEIQKLNEQLGLDYAVSEGVIYSYIQNISSTIDSIKGILWMVSIFLLIVLSGIFLGIQIWSFHKNKKVYAIHLICGCSFKRIKQKIMFFVIAQFAAALLGSTLISSVLLEQKIANRSQMFLFKEAVQQMILCSVVLLVIICVILSRSIHKNRIYLSLRN